MTARPSTIWLSRAAAPLLAVLLAAGADAQITAALARCPIPRGASAWSRPSTWPGGVVPGPGTDVVIPAGQTVVLDFDNVGGFAHVKSLTIEGALHVSCGGGTLRADSILVNGGTFAIGAAHRPYPDDVTITLSHNAALDDYGSATHPGEMLDQALVVQDGGVLELHGRDHGKSWTQLAETAMPGDTQIRLTEASTWEPGQEIVLASTDYDLNQAEVREIAQVNGDVVTLTAPLFQMHWGEIEGPFANGMSVDERGEVGLLSRSIVVQGTPFTLADGRVMGGHTMVHRGPGGFGATTPRADITWVEFRDLGREGALGRYPLHLHRAGTLADTRIDSCSVRNSFNRVVSFHDVNEAEITNCVAFEHIGHGYYFEGPSSSLNRMNGNLGLGTRAAQPGREILASDLEPGTFWLENPRNEIRSNVAAGSEDFGYWWEPPAFATVSPDFDGNVAHSNGSIGVYQDSRPPTQNGLVQGLTLYKNREHALWWRTYGRMTFRGLMFADNRAGTYLASEGVQFEDDFSYIRLEDSLLVGESNNAGQPFWNVERARGRSLPQPGNMPSRFGFFGPEWDALVGVEMYDGAVRIARTHFARFQDANDTCGFPECSSPTTFRREAGAISNVDYHNPWAFLPTNSVAALSFEDADEIWLRTPVGAPLFDNGIANTVFLDEDGSVTGTPMTYIRPVNSFLEHEPAADTVFVPEWNAHTMQMVQPDGPGGALVSYRYGLFQWQHPVADAPALDQYRIQRIPISPTLSFQAFDVRSATSASNPYSLMPSTLVPGAAYALSAPGLQAFQWPGEFSIRWGGTAPGDFIIVSVPYPESTATVRFNGVLDLAPASSLAALYQSTASDHFLDAGPRILHLKLFVGGLGPSVWAGRMVQASVTR